MLAAPLDLECTWLYLEWHLLLLWAKKKKKSVTMHHQGKGYYFEILCSMLLKLPASELSVVLGKHKDFHAHPKDRYPAFLGLEC